MLGHCRRLNPFLNMAVAVARVEAQADQFFRHPPDYRAYFDARAGWQSEGHQHRLRQRKLAGVLQGHTIGPELHAAGGEGEVVSLDSDVGHQVYPWMLARRGKDGLDAALRPHGGKLPQDSLYWHFANAPA